MSSNKILCRCTHRQEMVAVFTLTSSFFTSQQCRKEPGGHVFIVSWMNSCVRRWPLFYCLALCMYRMCNTGSLFRRFSQPDDTEEVLFGEIADEDLRHEDDYDDNGAEATSFTVFRPVNTEHSTHSKSTASSATTAPVRIDRRHSVVFHHVASSLPGSPSTTPNSVGIAMATASPGPSLPRSLDRNAEDRLAKVQLRPAMDLFSVGSV